MRIRINKCIISSDGNIVQYKETKSQIELAKRRANFEKNRKELRKVIIVNSIPTDLISFNTGVINAIMLFKKQRNECRINC